MFSQIATAAWDHTDSFEFSCLYSAVKIVFPLWCLQDSSTLNQELLGLPLESPLLQYTSCN